MWNLIEAVQKSWHTTTTHYLRKSVMNAGQWWKKKTQKVKICVWKGARLLLINWLLPTYLFIKVEWNKLRGGGFSTLPTKGTTVYRLVQSITPVLLVVQTKAVHYSHSHYNCPSCLENIHPLSAAYITTSCLESNHHKTRLPYSTTNFHTCTCTLILGGTWTWTLTSWHRTLPPPSTTTHHHSAHRCCK